MNFFYKYSNLNKYLLYLNIFFYINLFFLVIFLLIINEGKSNNLSLLIRFFLMPVFAIFIAYIISNKLFRLNFILSEKNKKLIFLRGILISSLIYFLLICFLKIIKYNSLNYEYFDTGIYFSKLWRISNLSTINSLYVALVEGHFQPILLLYSLIFHVFDSFIPILILQSLTIVSGVIPICLLVIYRLKNYLLSLIIGLSYFFNPIIQFNDILGFNPDHIVLPLLLWSFYFAEKNKFFISISLLFLLVLSSEAWIISAAAFGFYLWIGKEKKLIGLSVILFFSLIFTCIFFFILPLYGSINSWNYVFDFNESKSVYSNFFNGFSSDLLNLFFDKRKFFYIFFIFFPFLFLSFKSLPILLVAIPEFIKTLASNELLHYSVEGHYTLVIIAVVFVSYINALHSITIRYGLFYITRISIITLFLSITFSISHGPLPISFNFWSNFSSGSFNYKNYLFSDRYNSLINAEKLILNNPHNYIEISNSAFTPKLSQNYINPHLFPTHNWKSSDYILIDKNKHLSSGSSSSDFKYNNTFHIALSQIEIYFDCIFDDSGIQLWRHKIINRNDVQ